MGLISVTNMTPYQVGMLLFPFFRWGNWIRHKVLQLVKEEQSFTLFFFFYLAMELAVLTTTPPCHSINWLMVRESQLLYPRCKNDGEKNMTWAGLFVFAHPISMAYWTGWLSTCWGHMPKIVNKVQIFERICYLIYVCVCVIASIFTFIF